MADGKLPASSTRAKRRPNEDRFWEKVDRGGPGGCWEWTAYLNCDGYGTFRWHDGQRQRSIVAHRASWMIHHGPIPAGMFVLHGCDNPACVNPAHLGLGDNAENMRQRKARRRYSTAFKRGQTIREIVRRPKVERLSVQDRIKSSVIIDADGCWTWQKARCLGYGYITVNRRLRRAHRVAYEEFVGPIPEGKFLLHTCDNRACCNPDHLRVGDHKTNMREMAERGRAAAGKDNHFGRVSYPGEKHPNASLTEDAVRAIRASTEPHKALAAKLGVSPGTVWKVRNGYSWTHVV